MPSRCFKSLPSIAAGHGLPSITLGAFCQWPGYKVGDGPACCSIVWEGLLKPGGEAQGIAGQGNLAMTPFLVSSGVWEHMYNSSSLQLCMHQEWHCTCTMWQCNVVQSQGSCIGPLKHDCHSRLNSMPSLSSNNWACMSVLLLLHWLSMLCSSSSISASVSGKAPLFW